MLNQLDDRAECAECAECKSSSISLSVSQCLACCFFLTICLGQHLKLVKQIAAFLAQTFASCLVELALCDAALRFLSDPGYVRSRHSVALFMATRPHLRSLCLWAGSAGSPTALRAVHGAWLTCEKLATLRFVLRLQAGKKAT